MTRFLGLAAGMAALLDTVALDDGALDLAPVYLPPDLEPREARMNDPLSPWASAAEIASAVGGGATTASAVAETTLARIAALNPDLNAYTDVTAERALDEAARVDARHRQRRAPRAAGGRPFRGEEPLRRGRPAHPGRLEDQPRPRSLHP